MKRLIFLMALLAAVASPLLSSSVARADGEIQVTNVQVESDFPRGLLFKVEARGPDPIDEIKVSFRSEGRELQSYGYADFSPAPAVSGEFLLKTGLSGVFIPPGTAFYYTVEVRDKKGREVRTPERLAVYLDNRFEWRDVTEGPVTVYYYGPTESRADTVLRTALQTVDRMSKLLGLKRVPSFRLVSYNNYRHLSGALPPRAAAIAQDLITEGQTWPDKRVALVMNSDPRVEGVVSHEVGHIMVADAAQQAYARIPAWLNEGLAEYANSDPGVSYDQALRFAIFTRRLRPLWYLGEFGGDPDGVIIAYGQSRSVVQFMVDKYGPEKMAELFRAVRQTLSIDEALKRAYGFDQHGLDTEWRQSLGLEALPRPEELERQRRQAQVTEPTPTPTPPPAAPAPEVEKKPKRGKTAPTPTPQGKEGRHTTATCNIQTGGARVPIELSFLGIMLGPLGYLSLRWFNRRRR